MKKALLFAGLAAAALSFASCNKQEADVQSPDGKTVEIVLTNPATRTANDGLTTNWVSGDALNVFYAPTGTTTYSSNTEFDITDVDNNKATGTVSLTEDAYDWYLLYPYSKYIKTPANTSSGYIPVGCKSNASQTQAGLNSTAHLAGSNLPVWGVAKNVSASDNPAVEMKHVTSVVKVNLTNASSEAITVSEIAFTGTEDIVGTYYIDFSGDEPAFAGSGTNYVSETATLAVSDADALAAGASAAFYIAVKPFTASAGDTLTVKVTADAGYVEKEVVLTKDVEFKSGYIKTLNVSFDKAAEVPTQTLAEALELADGDAVNTEEVLVVAAASTGCLLYQGGSYLFVYNSTAAVGDKVTVSGTMATYGGMRQVSSATITVVSSGNTVTHPDVKDITSGFDSYSSSTVEYVKMTGTLSISNSRYYNVAVTGASNYTGSFLKPLDADLDAVTALNGKVVDVTGYYVYFSSGKYVYLIMTAIEETETSVFGVSQEAFEVSATTTSIEVEVTGNVDWTVTPGDNCTASPASGSGAGTVTVTFPANTEATAKEYVVHVATEDTTVEETEYEIIINQAAYDPSNLEYEWDLSTASFTSQSDSVVVWSGDVTMTAEKNESSTSTNNYLGGLNGRTSSRFYKNSKVTLEPASSYSVKYVEFTATSESYATAFQQSAWNNATAVIDDVDTKLVTVTPTEGTSAFYAVIGAACGFTKVVVYYAKSE